MRAFLIILILLMIRFSFSQNLTDKYLHFKTDYYWDTTLYKSEKVYYFEMNNGQITQKEYPVLEYLFTLITSEIPLVTKDSFERREWSNHPYKYVMKRNSIFLQYFDLGKRKLKLNKEYSLNPGDTVSSLADKNSLDSKYGISVGGFSTYLGVAKIEINGKQFNTFRFLEDHYKPSSHPSYFTKEVFLDQATLIPLKFISTSYDFKTRTRKLYYSATTLVESSNVLEDYTNQKSEDLIIYELKNTTWTEKQKSIFLNQFGSDPKLQKYLQCLLELLDGQVSFYNYKRNPLFQSIAVHSKCDELIPKR